MPCDIKKSSTAKHTQHTTQGHGRDFDLGLLLSCYSSGDQHNLQDSQSLILKIFKLLKYLRRCFVACSMLWEVKDKGLTETPPSTWVKMKGNLNLRLSSQKIHELDSQWQLGAWQDAMCFEGQKPKLGM